MARKARSAAKRLPLSAASGVSSMKAVSKTPTPPGAWLATPASWASMKRVKKTVRPGSSGSRA